MRQIIKFALGNGIKRLYPLVRRQVGKHSCLGMFLNKLYQLLPYDVRWSYLQVEEFLQSFAEENKEVFFIQIGAGDGFTTDNLHRFIVDRRWSGILIEPVPYLFERLKNNYSACPSRLILENVAISEQVETRDFWYLKPAYRTDWPEWFDQIGSLSKEQVIDHALAIPKLNDYLVEEKVLCLSIDALLEKHKVERVDLLLIDAEGYDYIILKQFDFDKLGTKLVIYEHKNLSSEEIIASQAYLKRFGFSLQEVGGNTVASKKTGFCRYQSA